MRATLHVVLTGRKGISLFLLYRQYYGDFVVTDLLIQSEVETTKDYFSPTDATIVSALANMIQENIVRFSQQAGAARPFITIEDAAFMDLGDHGLQIHADINSPGVVQVYGAALAPLVFKVFFALALTVDPTTLAAEAQNGNIEVTNSLALHDSEEHRAVTDEVVNLLRLIGADDLERTVRLVREFNERTGGNVNANVAQ